jgi:peptide/nickel transport system permease protein
LLLSVVILFFVAFIIYALMRCLPTSYIEATARQKSMTPGSKSYEEWMEQLTAMYNMDSGIITGFFRWLGSMFRGEFGDSWKYTVPVLTKFNDTVWLSFVMGLISFILEIIIAVPLGIIAATKQYSKTDYTISVIALAGISLPTFFFASLLKLVFSVKLGWFDLYGLVGRNYDQLDTIGQLLDKGNHLILPIVTLVVVSMGSLMRYTRTNML